MDDLSQSLAATVVAARRQRGLSVNALAEASGVSRAMIGKIERGEAQPTAALLGRLSGALGLTLSELIARAEGGPERLARRDEQPAWTDPTTGYRRQAISPAGAPLELVEVVLPDGARIGYPADSYAFIRQQIWLIEGRLRFIEGEDIHQLGPGDCLQLGPPQDCAYVNDSGAPCRYLVALTRR